MSIESSTKSLQNLLATYKQSQDAIGGNKQLSESYKKERLNALYNETLPRARVSVTKLWGAIEDTADGRFQLSKSGEVWATFGDLEARVARARQTFLEKYYISPSMRDIIEGRAKTIVANAKTPEEFEIAFAKAAPDVQSFLRDTAAMTIPGSDQKWEHIKRRLEREREALETAAVEPAQNAMNSAVEAAYNALLVSREVANIFARDDYYLSQFQQGIYATRFPIMEIREQEWGVHFVNANRVMKFDSQV